MGNPKQDDDEELSPEELILEAMASSALDPEKPKSKSDNVENVLASVPTELNRGENLQRTTPGAFRGGSGTEPEEDLQDASDTSFRISEKPLVEAMLVDSPSAELATSRTDNNVNAEVVPNANGAEELKEVYKAEPIQEGSKNSGKKWFWIGLALGAIMSIIAVTAVVLVLRLDKEEPTKSDMERDMETLARFGRVTDHVVFQGLRVHDDCRLKKSRFNKPRIRLSCGPVKEQDDDGFVSEEDPPLRKPFIVLREGPKNCERVEDAGDEIICDVTDDKPIQLFVFSCGTDPRQYPPGSVQNVVATASAQIEAVDVSCNEKDSSDDGSNKNGGGFNNGGGEDGGRRMSRLRRRANGESSHLQLFAYVAMGRMCKGPPLFNPVGSQCLPTNQTLPHSFSLDTGPLESGPLESGPLERFTLDFCYKDKGCNNRTDCQLGQFKAADILMEDASCESPFVDSYGYVVRRGELDELEIIRQRMKDYAQTEFLDVAIQEQEGSELTEQEDSG